VAFKGYDFATGGGSSLLTLIGSTTPAKPKNLFRRVWRELSGVIFIKQKNNNLNTLAI